MKQPDLGLTVTRLRLQKGLTQESLAELCEVSTRTIQRIERGEADPRTFTINCLANILEFNFNEENNQNERFWIMAMHLSSMLCFPVIPLLIWSLKKKNSLAIDKHGKRALNFQLSITIYMVSIALLYTILFPSAIILMEKFNNGSWALFSILGLVGFVPLIGIGIFCFIQGLKNGMRVMAEKPIKYALSIPFLK